MAIIRGIARRLSELDARSRLTASQAEELDAKADFVAMMTDVDLSLLDEGEEGLNHESDVSEG